MKKIIALSLGLITLPFISAMGFDSLYPTLNTVLTDIKSAYQEQWAQFNATPTSRVPSIFTPTVQKAITSLKGSLSTLNLLISSTELKDVARDLRNMAIQIINSMQVLDGNIEKVLDDKGSKKIIDDTLIKLKNLEKKAGSIKDQALIDKMNKFKRSKDAPPFNDDEVIAVHKTALIIMNLADTVRKANEKILNVFFKPKKSKNVFKRIFGS